MDVSVVIPTKNRSAFLAQAIDSVRLALAGLAGEVIVVDDGSTDDTAAVATAHGATVVVNSGTGVSDARNTGIAAAKGPLVAFLDDDDVWLPSHLRLHLAAHSQRPEIGVSYSQGRLTDSALAPVTDGYPAEPLPTGSVLPFVLSGRIQQVGTVVVRREALLSVGGFDSAQSSTEDLDLMERLAERYQFAAIEQPTVLWRQHRRLGGGSFRAWADRYRESREMLQRSLSRGSAAGMPFSWALMRRVRCRGWAVHDAFLEVDRCAGNRQRAEAGRLVLHAFLVSPPHAVLALWRFRRTWFALQSAQTTAPADTTTAIGR